LPGAKPGLAISLALVCDGWAEIATVQFVGRGDGAYRTVAIKPINDPFVWLRAEHHERALGDLRQLAEEHDANHANQEKVTDGEKNREKFKRR
jgi:hypothetical protein